MVEAEGTVVYRGLLVESESLPGVAPQRSSVRATLFFHLSRVFPKRIYNFTAKSSGDRQ